MQHDERMREIAQHLRNLCRIANSEPDMSYLHYHEIKTAVNMAATVGYNCCVWGHPWTGCYAVIEVHDTETDEVIAMSVEDNPFPYEFRHFYTVIISRFKSTPVRNI